MKKAYIMPQNSVVSSRIRCSILAGSDPKGTPNASGVSTSLVNNKEVKDYNSAEDGGLGARVRFGEF